DVRAGVDAQGTAQRVLSASRHRIGGGPLAPIAGGGAAFAYLPGMGISAAVDPSGVQPAAKEGGRSRFGGAEAAGCRDRIGVGAGGAACGRAGGADRLRAMDGAGGCAFSCEGVGCWTGELGGTRNRDAG